MSFPSSYSDDLGSDAFASSYGDLGPDYFDDLLTFNPGAQENHNYSILSDPNFFQTAKDEGSSANTSSSTLGDDVNCSIGRYDTEDELWAQTTLSQGNPIYPESFGRAALPESEILSLESITLDSPRTPAHFKTPLRSSRSYDSATFLRRPSGITDTPTKIKNGTGCVERNSRNPIRKTSSVPSMTRSSQKSNSNLWAAKLEFSKLAVDFQDKASIPSSISTGDSAPLENSRSTGWLGSDCGAHVDQMAGVLADKVFDFETPPNQVSDVRTLRRRDRRQVSKVSDSLFLPNPEFDHSSNGGSQMHDGLPVFDPHGDPSMYTSGTDSPLWWNHAATAPMAQPSPTALHVNPERAAGSVAIQLQNKMAHNFNGLPYRPSSTASDPLDQILGLPSEQSLVADSSTQQYCLNQPRPQYHTHQNSNDPSPSQSRLVRKPRFDPSELDAPSPSPSPGIQVRKCKPQKPLKQTTPRTTSLGAPADFVNYTPDDSLKILTGVAPSGSSKTKARREKEALERRRKLSQAAVRAVQAAGGDVSTLVEEGLLV
jgi:hypothetical protein